MATISIFRRELGAYVRSPVGWIVASLTLLLQGILFQVFAALALLLAAAGIYGVLAGNVTERTLEIGIRSALGASRSELLGLVLRQGLTLAAAGVVVGGAASLLLVRFLERLLYGVRPRDPVTFAVVVIVLLAVSVGASWAPAWRATRVSPLEAIRGE